MRLDYEIRDCKGVCPSYYFHPKGVPNSMNERRKKMKIKGSQKRGKGYCAYDPANPIPLDGRSKGIPEDCPRRGLVTQFSIYTLKKKPSGEGYPGRYWFVYKGPLDIAPWDSSKILPDDHKGFLWNRDQKIHTMQEGDIVICHQGFGYKILCVERCGDELSILGTAPEDFKTKGIRSKPKKSTTFIEAIVPSCGLCPNRFYKMGFSLEELHPRFADLEAHKSYCDFYGEQAIPFPLDNVEKGEIHSACPRRNAAPQYRVYSLRSAEYAQKEWPNKDRYWRVYTGFLKETHWMLRLDPVTHVMPLVEDGTLMDKAAVHSLQDGDWIVREDGHTRRFYHFSGGELKASTRPFDESEVDELPADIVDRTLYSDVKKLYSKLVREGRYDVANLILKLLTRRVLYIGCYGVEWEVQMVLEEIGARKYFTFDGERVTLYL